MPTALPPATLSALAPAAEGLRDAFARAALPVAPKPYWIEVGRGRHLGLYRGRRTATWLARRFAGAGRYEQIRLGPAADPAGPARPEALDFETALRRAHDWWRPRGTGTGTGPGRAQAPVSEPRGTIRSGRLDAVGAAWKVERPDLDLTLVGLFLRMEHAHYWHERRMAAISHEIGLAQGDLHVVLALRRSGVPYALRPTDLFRSLLVTSGAISKRLERLERLELVERRAGAGDRRSWEIRLTPAGIRAADAAIESIARGLNALRASSGLAEAELQAADGSLRRLLAPMPALSGEPG